ncbi:MAG: NfeD family protein [Myxococcota bacterium]|nr:NfeD family protein [Myxococcota bacterium]
MPVFLRYLVFQLPSWMLATVVLGMLAWYETLPVWVAGALVAALVAKDLLLFPRLRHAYGPGPTDGAAAMRGALVEADTPLCPAGFVRFGAERWRARLADAKDSADAGETLRVREVDRLTLLVEPCRPAVVPTGEHGSA